MNSIRTVIGSTCLAALVAGAFGCSSDGDGGDGGSGAGGTAGTSAGGSTAGTGMAGAAAGAPSAGAAFGGAPAAGAPAGGAPAGGAPAAGAPAAGAPAAGAPAGGAPAAGAPAGGSGGAAPPMGLPASDSKDALLSFIKGGTWKSAPWKSETAAAREAKGGPHGKVRVWMNEQLLNSFSSGMSKTPSQYSMSVKELFGNGDEPVGHAVTYHAGAGSALNDYTFICVGPADLCYKGAPAATEAAPIYGKGLGVQCGFCHSPLGEPFITRPPQ